MKATSAFLVAVLCSVAFFALSMRPVQADAPTVKVITDFVGNPLTTEPSITAYPTFRSGVRPISVGGYGIYSTFSISKDMLVFEENGVISFRPWVCREDYCIRHFAGWHTFRRQFPQTIDLSQADGIEITIEVEKPLRGYIPKNGSNTYLRFVLCDRNRTRQSRDNSGFDNQWLYDLPKTILYSAQTITQKMPFGKFRKPDWDEEGSRISVSRRFRPADTSAYEIAIIGNCWKEFKVTRVAAYKEVGK